MVLGKEDGAGVEEWEVPLHPGSRWRSYPTIPHNATLLAHNFPLRPLIAPRVRKNHRKSRDNRPRTVRAQARPGAHDPLQERLRVPLEPLGGAIPTDRCAWVGIRAVRHGGAMWDDPRPNELWSHE